MFDDNERKILERIGLNCFFIEEGNKDKKFIELDYLNKNDFAFNENVQQTTLYSKETFQDFNISFYEFPILILDPRYWHDAYIDIINKYQVSSLIFSTYLTVFLKKQTTEKKKLVNIDFLKQVSSIKQFYLQAQKDMAFEEFWDIENFTPLEYLHELEYLNISNSETIINIDFSKLKKLQDVNLQFPKENITIYECTELKRLTTRTYLKDFTLMQNLKKLEYFVSYAKELKSFKGIGELTSLKTLDLEVTSKIKNLEEMEKLVNLEEFVLRGARALKTFDGIEKLPQLKRLLSNDLKKLESVENINNAKNLELLVFENSIIPEDLTLKNCQNLKKLKFENCKLLNDLNEVTSLESLEELEIIDCKNISSLAFVKKLKKLNYLNFAGNTIVKDGNLEFLKKLSLEGVNISFNNRQHYNINLKDVNEELVSKLDEITQKEKKKLPRIHNKKLYSSVQVFKFLKVNFKCTPQAIKTNSEHEHLKLLAIYLMCHYTKETTQSIADIFQMEYENIETICNNENIYKKNEKIIKKFYE